MVTMHYVVVFYVRYRRFRLKLKFFFKFDNTNLVLRTEGYNACYIGFEFDGNFEIFILWNSGREFMVATAIVSSSTSLNPLAT